jgi:hypothetical protein
MSRMQSVKKINRKNIATCKIFFDRAKAWATYYSFFMMFYLYSSKILDGASLGVVQSFVPFLSIPVLEFILIVFPFILIFIITIFDIRYILPSEQEYYLKVNPEWQKRDEK